MAKLTCMIVEDEVPAQKVLQSFIEKVEWLQLETVCGDAMDAMDFLNKHRVDLIFLDIQVPGITGLEFLKILKHPPQVIITTAYNQYAVEAFELDVRDYLMKPFSFERFLKAVNRVTPNPLPAHVHQLDATTPGRSFAFFNVNKVMVKVMFADIRYVESMREYVYIHTQGNKVVTKIGIGEMEKLLGSGFIRIHRSYLVNAQKITAYNAEEVFIGEVCLPIGANYKKLVERSFEKNLPSV